MIEIFIGIVLTLWWSFCTWCCWSLAIDAFRLSDRWYDYIMASILFIVFLAGFGLVLLTINSMGLYFNLWENYID